MSGPPKKPTALKILEGNPGKQKLNKLEPKPSIPSAVPEPPDFLNAEAKAEWWRRAPELHRLRVLTSVDVSVLAAYCQAYSRWRAAEIALAKMGEADMLTGAMMIRTANGNPIQNPILGVASRALEQMSRLAAEYGMTPAARAKIEVDDEALKNDPLSKLHLLTMPQRRA